jgi:AP-1 complex subunit mu
MRAHFGLPSVKSGIYSSAELSRRHNPDHYQFSEQDVEKRAPITVKFEIPYFTVSGIQVRYLKVVEKSGYQALPWVRYITQNGDDYRCVCKERVQNSTNASPSLRTALDKGSAPIVPM